jgi:hypothetical protein
MHEKGKEMLDADTADFLVYAHAFVGTVYDKALAFLSSTPCS